MYNQLVLKHVNIKQRKSPYRILKYVYIVLLPIVFAIAVRTFLWDIYYIPSSSMEQTLFPGDYVVVNKVSYGVKLPKRLQDVPVIGSWFKTKINTEHQYKLYYPLKGYKSFKRHDIVVFKSVTNNNKFLIKRIVGLPGDTLSLKDTKVIVNNNYLEEKPEYSYMYSDSSKAFASLKIYANKDFEALAPAVQKKLTKLNSNTPSLRGYSIFPFKKQNQWTRDNYGPVIIPKKGTTISLTKANIAIYASLIKYYEQEDISLKHDNDQVNYTFKQNYYFMLGDNRHNSIDSRSYGFVVESYIQGKMVKVI